jgi:hypothetical protein
MGADNAASTAVVGGSGNLYIGGWLEVETLLRGNCSKYEGRAATRRRKSGCSERAECTHPMNPAKPLEADGAQGCH